MRTNNAINAQPLRTSWAIFFISVLGLYLELMLIRWIGTEIRIFAYLQNTVLVVCFMGLGLGLFTSTKPITLRQILIPLGVLILLMAIPATRSYLHKISYLLSVFQDLIIWFKHPGLFPTFWNRDSMIRICGLIAISSVISCTRSCQ